MPGQKTEFSFPDEADDKKDAKQAEDKLEIVVEDDTPEQDRNRKPLEKEVDEVTEDELEGYSEKVKARINELTHARHDERRRREAIQREHEEAVRIAEAIAQENKRLKQSLEEGTTNNATQSKELAEIRLAQAKSKMRAAHEAGDSDALVDAQQEVAQAVLALERATSFKPTPLQKESASDKVEPTTPERTPVQPKPDTKAVAWRRENPWFGSDKRMTAFALGVHQELVESGYDTSSDEYYNTLNKELKAVFPKAFKDDTKSDTKPPATVVAPATRSSGPKKVTLTKTQVQIANRLGIPLEEYARHQALLESRNG